MPVSTNTTPNQNNLFDIFRSQVESLSDLNNVIVKAKVNKKMGARISEAVEVTINATTSIYSALDKISSGNTSRFDNASKVFNSATTTLSNILSVISNLGTMHFGSVLLARIRIWRLYTVTWYIMKFLWRVGMVNPIVFTSGTLTIRAMASNVDDMVNMVKQLGKIPVVALLGNTKKAIRKLYTVLFGDGLKVRKRKRIGLYDIYKRLAKPTIPTTIVKGSLAINLMSSSLRKLISTINIMGISLPLLLMGWASVKILNPITSGLIRIFRKVGRNTKTIIKGSIALEFMATSLVGFMGSILLVGVAAVAGAAMIGVAIVTIIGVIGLLILLGSLRVLLKHGKKSIKYIAQSVAMLAMVAITISLLGMFVSQNMAGFLQFGLYLTLLVGVFYILSVISRSVRKGGRTILLITICVGMLAMVAITVALTGQFITANLVFIASVLVCMTGIIGLVVLIGVLQKHIVKGVASALFVVIFSLTMVAIVGALALISTIGDPLEMLAIVGIMSLIVTAIGGISIAAGMLLPRILKGIPAMIMISVVAGLLSVVMIGIATASAIDDPLEMLEIVGVMSLLVVAVGGIAITAGLLLMGPQAIAFALGMTAIGLISGLLAAISGVALIMANTTKAIKDTGFTDPKDLADMINLPFVAIIKGGSDGTRLFDMLKELPGTPSLIKIKMKLSILAGTVSSIGKIADTLHHIGSLNMPVEWDSNGNPSKFTPMSTQDFVNASMNAAGILGVTAGIFNDSDKTSTYTFAGGVTAKVTGISLSSIDNISLKAKIKIKRLSKIIGYVGNMATTLQHIAALRIPGDEYDENGNPKSYRQMSGNDFKNAALNTSGIIKFFAALFGDAPQTIPFGGTGSVLVSPLDQATLDNISRSTKRKIKRLSAIVSVVGGLAETLQNISSMTVPDTHGPEDYDENGKPKKWRQMNPTDFTNAIQVVQNLLVNVASILGDDELEQRLANISRRNIRKIKLVMESIQGITGVIDIIKAIAGGRMAVRWEMDNNQNSPTYGQEVAVEYIDLNRFLSGNQAKVQKTISDLIMCPINAIAAISNNKTAMKALKDSKKSVKSIVSILQKIKDPVIGIVETYTDKISHADPEAIGNAYKLIIQNTIDPFIMYEDDVIAKAKKSLWVFERVVVAITGGKVNGSQMNGIQPINNQNSQNFQKNVHEVTGLIKQIGTTDINKLKYASNLMSRLAQFSASINGNFKELSHIINEDLIAALEKLEETLKGFQGDINVDTKPSQIGDVLKDSGTDRSAKNKPVTTEKTDVNYSTDMLDLINEIADDINAIRHGKKDGDFNFTGIRR